LADIFDKASDGYVRTAPVGVQKNYGPDGQLSGFFDLGGNAAEWVLDNFNGSPLEDRTARRVIRGGSWQNGTSSQMESSFRESVLPDSRLDFIGFRIVAELEGKSSGT
jgi:formylglycine-generating enzyme required for sulfatase activity